MTLIGAGENNLMSKNRVFGMIPAQRKSKLQVSHQKMKRLTLFRMLIDLASAHNAVPDW